MTLYPFFGGTLRISWVPFSGMGETVFSQGCLGPQNDASWPFEVSGYLGEEQKTGSFMPRGIQFVTFCHLLVGD